MSILVLRRGRSMINYTLFAGAERRPQISGQVEAGNDPQATAAALLVVHGRVRSAAGRAAPESLAVLTAYGGEAFDGPVPIDDRATGLLAGLATEAPLHVPPVLDLLGACREVFPGVGTALVFETAFFARLPARERFYAADSALTPGAPLRRYGHHGVFHHAACLRAAALQRTDAPRGPARTISVCLEPRPELSAAVGLHPVMVTGGATPLEGLPGRTGCGDLDPGVVLHLVRKLAMGPEEVNRVLTERSGLAGLVGRPVTLAEVLAGDDAGCRLAADVFRYRLLLACGAALAALGGVDALVFSGREAALGRLLGPWLAPRLARRGSGAAGAAPWSILDASLDRLAADQAVPVLAADRTRACAAGSGRG